MAVLVGLGVERTTGFGVDVDPAPIGACAGDGPSDARIAGRCGARPVTAPLRVSEAERRRRWRLLLGPAGDEALVRAEGDRDGDSGSGDSGSGDSGSGDSGSGDSGSGGLHGDDVRIDAALGALYDRDDREGAPDGSRRGAGRSGGLGRSKPGVIRWLGDIRRYFPTPVVQILQRDAVDRLDLRQLLLEPELLQDLEPDIHLVTLLVELNRHLPDETRATARLVIARVLADLERRLTDQTRQAVRGALARSARTRRPRPATSTGR